MLGLSKKRKGKPKGRQGPVDADNFVVQTVYCIKCGSDLLGLSLEAMCPTCQHAVYDSVYGGYLIDAAAGESRRLRDMSNLVLYPAIFVGVLSVIAVLATILVARQPIPAIDSIFDVLLFCAMPTPIIALVGSIVFTGRHTADYYIAKYGRPRPLIWGISIAVAALIAFGLILNFAGYIATAIIVVAFVAIPAATFFQRLANLGRRIPSRRLATLSSLAFVLTVATSVAAVVVLVLRPATKGRELAAVHVFLTLLAELGAVGLGIAGIRLLLQARRTLRAIDPLGVESQPKEESGGSDSDG